MSFSDEDSRRRFLPRSLLLSLVGVLFLTAVPLPVDAAEQPVSFVNDVMPVLTKAGCNVGVCHAKAGGGQKGFQLSLLGFEPLEDFDHLVRESRSRRLFFGAPDRSLLLLKATGQPEPCDGLPGAAAPVQAAVRLCGVSLVWRKYSAAGLD